MTVKELKSFFKLSLSEIYPDTEIESFFYLLAEEFLSLSPVETVIKSSETIDKNTEEKWKDALSRLKKNEPVQYIIGKTEFFGLPFQVNPHVLIPRPETEELVELVLKDISQQPNKKLKFLDIGTGSGCIAISLAKHLPSATISAMDVSEEALAVAMINADLNEVNLQKIHADVLQLNSLSETYDIIVSNPPYIRHLEKKLMHKNVLDFEPELALFVEDANPLLFYQKIAELAKASLTENGQLYFEINEFLAEDLIHLLQKEGFDKIRLFKDVYDKNRMIKAEVTKRNSCKN